METLTCLAAQRLPLQVPALPGRLARPQSSGWQEGCKGFMLPSALSQTQALPTPSLRDKKGRLHKSFALHWRDRMAPGSPARPHGCYM